MEIASLFDQAISVEGNLILREDSSEHKNQEQTKESFSGKWDVVEEKNVIDTCLDDQLAWYLELYGFDSEEELSAFLGTKKIILDAGCGNGYKTAWLANLAKDSIVIGMDLSEGAVIAAKKYADIPNLFFVRGDIANTGIKEKSIDYVSCDQVIMHTEEPNQTFAHLTSLLSKDGEFSCYVYAKKALPRELLDDYFRTSVHNYSQEQIWELSKQLTDLGKALSDLKVNIESPDIPLLGIKGGTYDLQRFIYWNFIKCFWHEEWGYDTSVSTNFDWYSPSNAKRYTEEEFRKLIADNQLAINTFHKEEACYSGRFKRA